jgi:E3 ubiquitin-protein ligase RNF146
MYDERTSMELEEMFKLGESSCEMLICGTLYVIDFKHSQQYRKDEPTKSRRIKRDLKTAKKKGIAGLR